jgi:hypothetical protein
VLKQLGQLQRRGEPQSETETEEKTKKLELTPAEATATIGRALRRRLRQANRNARSRARLRKADIYATMMVAYAAVQIWKRRDIAGEVERLLRRTAIAAIAPRSSLFLVLLRSALPDLDPKRASKWAAALELADRKQVARMDFVEFMEGEGGVEGAARTRARLRALEAEADAVEAVSPWHQN